MDEQLEGRRKVTEAHEGVDRRHVGVIGAGLAGLTAAISAARSGARVTIFERGEEIGGRGRTVDRNGYLFNVGAHALYQGGAASRVLADFAITPVGKVPPANGFVVREGRLQILPSGPGSMLRANWLGARGRLPVAKLFAGLPKMNTAELAGVTVSEWGHSLTSHKPTKALLQSLTRLTTYCDEPDQLSAQVVADQLKLALDPGVLYLDGGWAALTAQLRERARSEGVTFVTSARVHGVTRSERAESAIEITLDTTLVRADAVVLAAGGPLTAAGLLGDAGRALTEAARDLRPTRAAAMDIGFRSLPNPRTRFVLGVDQPTYFSCHTPSADLAPAGGEVVHLIKYLGDRDAAHRDDRAELEAVLDLAQPRWRDHVDEQRFLAEVVVAHGIPMAASGGYRGRPGIAAAGIEGVFVAGDWVGDDGILADASMASGRNAGRSAADVSTVGPAMNGQGTASVDAH